MSTFDRNRYPLASKYLASLPEGMDSYPDCLVKVDNREDIRVDYPELDKDGSLPSEIKRFFSGEINGTWMPEVVGNTVELMVRDQRFDTDRAFLDWNKGLMQRNFHKPLYRILLLVASPTLTLMGAAKRWSSIHMGTHLEPKKVVEQQELLCGELLLSFPAGLFTPLLLEKYAVGFQTVGEVSGGKKVHYEWEMVGGDQARFVVSWQKHI